MNAQSELFLKQAMQAQQSGDIETAIKQYQDFLNKHPHHVEATYHLSLCYVMLKNWPMALGYLEQTTLMAPQEALFHNNFANALRITQQFERAEHHYRLALSLKPAYPEALNNLGVLFYHQAKWLDAIVQFEAALSLNEHYADAHANLAHCYVMQDQPQKAIEHYRQTLALQANHPSAQHNCGILLVQEHHFEEAKPHLEWSLMLDPHNTETLFHLALVDAGMNEPLSAIKRYRQILDLNPNHGNAAHNLATLYLANKQPVEALSWYEHAFGINPTNKTAEHMMHALQGKTTIGQTPRPYIENLFDQYAARYNEHLRHVLKYRAPELFRELLSPYTNRFSGAESLALDLGCGTGLMAPYLQDIVAKLIGIDLSKKMLAEAETQGGYHALIHGDIVDALANYPDPVDLVIAADVLGYLGDLNPLFAELARLLKPYAIFCFSTEVYQNRGFHLQTHGRFAHSSAYIHTLCQDHGFQILEQRSCSIREEENEPIKNELWILTPMSRSKYHASSSA